MIYIEKKKIFLQTKTFFLFLFFSGKKNIFFYWQHDFLNKNIGKASFNKKIIS